MIQPCLRHRVTHEELSFCVCCCVCLKHLWLTVTGFKELREVGNTERETTSENQDNNCFCTNSESCAHKEAIVRETPNHNKKGPIQAISTIQSVLYIVFKTFALQVAGSISKPMRHVVIYLDYGLPV